VERIWLPSAAFEQLRQSTANISDIAEQLGFQEPSVFHRVFKKWAGESPGRYRARFQVGVE
jgi:AraC-like DNA-binding protein